MRTQKPLRQSSGVNPESQGGPRGRGLARGWHGDGGWGGDTGNWAAKLGCRENHPGTRACGKEGGGSESEGAAGRNPARIFGRLPTPRRGGRRQFGPQPRVGPGRPGSWGRLLKPGRRAKRPKSAQRARAGGRGQGRSPLCPLGADASFQYLPRRALLPAPASGTCTRTCPRGPAPPRPAPPPRAPAPPPRATGPAPAAPAPPRPPSCPPASGARPRAAPSAPARAATPRPAAPAGPRRPRAAPPPRTGTAWRRAAQLRVSVPRGRRTWPEREAAAAIGRRRGRPGRQRPGRRRGHVRGCTFFGLHHAAQEPGLAQRGACGDGKRSRENCPLAEKDTGPGRQPLPAARLRGAAGHAAEGEKGVQAG